MKITDNELNRDMLLILRGLIANWGNEVVEFKEARNDYKQDEMADSMTSFNMIDTVAMGIRRVFRIQGNEGRFYEVAGR
jgi:hypothetical protein